MRPLAWGILLCKSSTQAILPSGDSDQMSDHNGQPLTAHKMVSAHAYSVLAGLSTVSLIAIAVLQILAPSATIATCELMRRSGSVRHPIEPVRVPMESRCISKLFNIAKVDEVITNAASAVANQPRQLR